MLLILIAVFCAALLCSGSSVEAWAGQTCLGIPILSEEEVSAFSAYRYQDHSEDLRFQGEHAAVDKTNSVIYISQKIGENTGVQDLMGDLTINLRGQKLYFAPDARWDDLSGAVRDGHGFRLLVSGNKNTYMEYEVVFTTLPVLYAYGNYAYRNNNNRSVMHGKMVLCDPAQLDDSGTGIHTAHLQWHLRGQTSSTEPKKPWKLSLKNSEGKNKDDDLLGLGADDDWILNPMNMEDSNIREKLFMDLWNELAAETDHNYPMSRGEYVEVLINGEYCGLYLLQRRIDGKYLALEEDTILAKGNQELRYEIVADGGDVALARGMLDAYFYDGNYEKLNLESFVDTSLFLQMFSSADNASDKNMFYIFEKTGDDYSVHLTPWDTDLSMGAMWTDEGFQYDLYTSILSTVSRKELGPMYVLHPELGDLFRTRWFELREELFTKEHIYPMMDAYLEVLDASGAVARDQETWGLYFGGKDTLENLYAFVDYRLQAIDHVLTN